MARTYQPELGQDLRQGFGNLGSLFAPPSVQELSLQGTLAKNQADLAVKANARTNIQNGTDSPADWADIGSSNPAKDYAIGKMFAYNQAHPGVAPTTYDNGVYITGGDFGKTAAGQQAAPLNADQSRILSPALAGALGVPAVQHGVVSLGKDDKMLPGGGTQPIVSAPSDDNAAPGSTDELAARVGWDAYQRGKSQAPKPPPSGAPASGPATSLPVFARGQDASSSSVAANAVASPGDALLKAITAGPPAAGASTPPGQDPLLQALFGASMQRLGKGAAPQTTIDMKGETAEAAESGKMAAQRQNELYQAADKAPEDIARLKLLSNVLQRTKTGPLAGAEGTAVAIANSVGIPPQRLAALGIDPHQATNNEVVQKLTNELVAGSIGAKGGGFPASNFSVAERQFIEKMFPSIASQPGSNEFVSDVLQARGQRVLQKMGDFSAYRRAQQQAGRPISFNDFDSAWQQQHAGENIFQPIIDRFNTGGYAPPGALPPQAGGSVAPPMQRSSIAAGPGGSSAAASSGATGAAPGGQQAAAPPAQSPMSAADRQAAIEAARGAIARGAPRDAVLQRLQQHGVDFSGAGI